MYSSFDNMKPVYIPSELHSWLKEQAKAHKTSLSKYTKFVIDTQKKAKELKRQRSKQ